MWCIYVNRPDIIFILTSHVLLLIYYIKEWKKMKSGPYYKHQTTYDLLLFVPCVILRKQLVKCFQDWSLLMYFRVKLFKNNLFSLIQVIINFLCKFVVIVCSLQNITFILTSFFSFSSSFHAFFSYGRPYISIYCILYTALVKVIKNITCKCFNADQ